MRARTACAFVLLGVLAGGRARAELQPPCAAAAARYDRALELARQGLFQPALDEFEAAYASCPKFAVLYDIGQTQDRLGHAAEAIAALERYLNDGADQVPSSRREQTEAQIAGLEARLARQTTDRPGAGEGDQPRPELSVGQRPPPAVPAPRLETSAPPAAAAESGPTVRRAPALLTGAGLLVGGAAFGVYLWNRGRYQDWQTENQALQMQPFQTTAYRNLAVDDNQLAESLMDANHTILGLSLAAGALVATGVTLFLVNRAHGRRGWSAFW